MPRWPSAYAGGTERSPLERNHPLEVIDGTLVLSLGAYRSHGGRFAELVAVGEFHHELRHHVVEAERYGVVGGFEPGFALARIDGHE